MKRILFLVLIVLVLTGCNEKNTLSGNGAELSQQKISSEASSASVSQSYTTKEQPKQESTSPITDEGNKSTAIFYQECGLSMTPDLVPQSEHEKKLLRYVGADIAGQLEDVPPEFEDRKQYSGQLFSYIYEDFDSDGICEMFAEATLMASFGLWFIDDEAAVMLAGNAAPFSVEEPLVLDMQNRKFVVFKSFGDASTTRDYMYGVRNGIPYETNISQRMIEGTNRYGEVLLIQSKIDIGLDGTGHSWKPYYFHIDEDGMFKEYGGVEASLEYVRSLPGANAILNENLPESAEITSVYYRDNGVININFIGENPSFKEYRLNRYLTLRFDGVKTLLEADEFGVYLAAYITGLAEYPTSLPKNK